MEAEIEALKAKVLELEIALNVAELDAACDADKLKTVADLERKNDALRRKVEDLNGTINRLVEDQKGLYERIAEGDKRQEERIERLQEDLDKSHADYELSLIHI